MLQRPKQYIKREIPHAGHHFAGLGNKDSSSTAVGASRFGGIAWNSVCCASVSMVHHCHTPRQCGFFTVLLMLLDKVREDASGVTDIKIRNAATSFWFKCFCLSEDSSLKTLTMETVQLDKIFSMIESSSSFGVHRLQALQVDLQIALKKVSRCWQPKQMRGWESRQLELDHVIWCDLTWWWSFGAKAPAVNPGFVQHCCDYAQILRRQHQTTMWVYQKCLTAQYHIFSLTQPNMLIFRTHNLVQNPTSDPPTIWWQSFQDQVPLANSGMRRSGFHRYEVTD